MQPEDLMFTLCITFVCVWGVVLHSFAIKLQLSDNDQFVKPIILIALSFSEITVCVVTIVTILLPFMLPREIYKQILPYIYCVKLMYVFLEHILSIDALLRLRWNIHYDPYKMSKIWKKIIALSLCFICGLMIIHAICSLKSVLFKIGLFAESSLMLVIFFTYIYILLAMNRYRVLPNLSVIHLIVSVTGIKGEKKKLKQVLQDLRPTLCNVPMLILITHLPIAGIPNLIFLAFLESGIHIKGRLLQIKFLLSAIGLVIDATLYVFSQPKIRRKIKRNFHKLLQKEKSQNESVIQRETRKTQLSN